MDISWKLIFWSSIYFIPELQMEEENFKTKHLPFSRNLKSCLLSLGPRPLFSVICILPCFLFVSSFLFWSIYISRVSNQNGVSPLYIMLEIHNSGWEPSICFPDLPVFDVTETVYKNSQCHWMLWKTKNKKKRKKKRKQRTSSWTEAHRQECISFFRSL